MQKRMFGFGCLLLVILLSLNFVLAEIDTLDSVTCDVYFEGYVFNSEIGGCELQGTSGCENPFKYGTKEECEVASFGGEKKDDLKCLPCGEACYPADQVAAMYCESSAGGEPECGVEEGECVVLGFEDDDLKDITDEEIDEELGDGGSINAFDRFFDGLFQSDLENMRERFAEIRTLISEGKIDEARDLLGYYKEVADKLEKEVTPEDKDEAVKLSKVIRKAINDLEDKISGEEDFDVLSEKANSVGVAVEIASKIKELCEQLAELDPEMFFESCNVGDDGPKWHKKLFEDLTDEQRKEAKEFGKIMSKCFETSGQDCRCEEITFTDFSIACEKASDLAVQCDIEGDEDACDDLDNLDMPELPDYLQDVFDDIEDKYAEDKYGMHMPKECVEAGVTSPKECGRIMIKEHAPLECRAALLEADVQSEREGREICDKIMFEKHSPRECIDEGITEPRECAEFMDNFRGPGGPGGFGGGFPGGNCMEIQDSTKRLKCFENAVGNVGEHYGPGPGFEGEGELTWQCKENRIHWGPDCEKFMREEWPELERQGREEGDRRRSEEGDWRVKERECADTCRAQDKAWDFYGGECVCNEGDYDDYFEGPSCDDCQSQCPGASGTGCGPNGCECYYDDDNYGSSGGGYGSDSCDNVNCGETSHCENGGCVANEYGEGEGPDYSSSGGGGSSAEGEEPEESSSGGGGDDSGGDDSGGESEGDNSGGGEPVVYSGDPVDNLFLNYWYG